jgi:hypothetical protein
MQTTLRINDDIYRQAKAKSGELGLSLTRFFEEAVEERLLRLQERPARPIKLPVSSVHGSSMSAEELKHQMETAQLEDDLDTLK